jgi:hypothetical protein
MLEKEKLSIKIYSYINVVNFKKYVDIEYVESQRYLDTLNRELHKICPELSLKLDKMYKMPGELNVFANMLNMLNELVLCLYYEGTCISSIQIKAISTGLIHIDSKTSSFYERNKYNKFLRAVSILISQYLTINRRPIIKMVSLAINPVSAFLLLKYFNASIDRDDVEELDITEQQETDKTITMEQLKQYIDSFHGIILNIIISDPVTIDCAQSVFDDLLQTDKHIKCPPEIILEKEKGKGRKSKKSKKKKREKYRNRLNGRISRRERKSRRRK